MLLSKLFIVRIKRIVISTATVLLWIISCCLLSTLSSAQLNTIWTYTNNPSTGSNELVRAITADETGVYAAALGNSGGIVKLDLNTGAILSYIGASEYVYAITNDASGIYIAEYWWVSGSANYQWQIRKLNKTTGAVIWSVAVNPSAYQDVPYAITTDASGVYIAGCDRSPGSGNWQWRIEKRDLNTGALLWSQVNNPSSGDDRARAIVTDATGVYIAGYGAELRVEKRNLSTGALIWAQAESGTARKAYAITVDASGIYLSGSYWVSGDTEWCIEKRDLTTGSLITGFGTNGVITYDPIVLYNDIAYAIIADASGLYIAGGTNGSASNGWRIEKRDLNNGSLLCAYTGPGAEIFSATIYASEFYAGGYDWTQGNDQWRVEKHDLSCVALPIELLSFTAQWLDENETDALLQWQTATEINNNYFSIERSIDGINFTSIGTVNGAGNSTSILNYQYIDNTLPEKTKADIFYYRLKQTDFDGQYSYSNIEVLTRGSITIIGPAPNPIGDELNFTLVSAMEGKVNITITDVIGQPIKEETQATHKGFQQIKILLPGLASGPYLLQVSTSDGVEKINKQFLIK